MISLRWYRRDRAQKRKARPRPVTIEIRDDLLKQVPITFKRSGHLYR